MKRNAFFITSTLALLSFAGCATDSDSTPADSGDKTTVTKQTIELSGACTIDACGSVPSSLSRESTVSCADASGASCAWASSSDDTSVSYRSCSDSECPEKPSLECPEGTRFASQSCGSENDGACLWTTICAPPRETTPCPESTGCDDLPLMEIGVICTDGSTGGFACVTDGQKCYWERNCD